MQGSGAQQSPVASSHDGWHDVVAWRHNVNQSCFIASAFLRAEA